MESCYTEWYTRTYKCRNGITEKTKYPVSFSDGCPSRSERRKAARRAGRAGDNAERQFARLLNNNFSENNSVHLALTYSKSGYKKLYVRAVKLRAADCELSERDAIFKAAQKELENLVRRVQYESENIKYIAATSDMNGKSLKPARIHHHIIVERDSLALCRKKWAKMGFVEERELYAADGDFTPLASYIIKQVRYIPDNKRYTHSRNIELPEPTAPLQVSRYADSEISIPSGAKLIYRSQFVRGQAQYVRYREPHKCIPHRPGAVIHFQHEPPGFHALL